MTETVGSKDAAAEQVFSPAKKDAACEHILSLEQALPLMQERLRAGGEVSFTARGTSMLPLFTNAPVVLTAAPERLKRGDLAFFRRRDGSFVLHRVVRVHKDGSYAICGDNQLFEESPVFQDQIIAVVCAYTDRSGRLVRVDAPKQRRYAALRMASLPFRRLYRRTRHFLGRILRPLLTRIRRKG